MKTKLGMNYKLLHKAIAALDVITNLFNHGG